MVAIENKLGLKYFNGCGDVTWACHLSAFKAYTAPERGYDGPT